MKITLRWPYDHDDYLTPDRLAALQGEPLKVLTQDDGGEEVVFDADVVNALRAEGPDGQAVFIQVELLDGEVTS